LDRPDGAQPSFRAPAFMQANRRALPDTEAE